MRFQPFFRQLKKFSLSAMAGLLVAGCGGGGDDSGSSQPIAVSLSPTTMNVTRPVGESGPQVTITATLNSAPTGPVFPVVVADKPVIRVGPTAAFKNADGSWSASFKISPTLALGTYSGTLTLMLCKDAQCASQYTLTGATLPYAVSIVQPSLSISKGGVALSTDAQGYYDISSGDVITVTTNIPSDSDVIVSAFPFFIPNPTGPATPPTSTTWTGMLIFGRPRGQVFSADVITSGYLNNQYPHPLLFKIN